MQRYVFALVFLLVCPMAQSQWRFLKYLDGPVERYLIPVIPGIIANYATRHLDTYLNVDGYLSRRGSAGTPEANYSEGLKRWRAGNKEEALRFMKWSAESDYSRAQLFLGDVCSQKGKFAEARIWYEKSASHLESWAEFQLGNLYYSGVVNGMPDYGTALGWYRRSASRHEVEAELRVGELLMGAKMHPMTQQEGVEVAGFMRDASNRGSGLGRAILGYMYEEGLGVARNFCTALDLTRQAAAQGVPLAVGNLGAAYESGISGGLRCMLARDRVEALDLYRRAARMGNSYSVDDAARLETALKNETASLASSGLSPSARMKACTVVAANAAIYDANLNRSGSTLASGQVSYAVAIGDDFAMLSTLSMFASSGSFVRVSQVSCNERLLW